MEEDKKEYRLGDTVLVTIIGIVQQGIAQRKDISQLLRELRVTPTQDGKIEIIAENG